MGYSLVRDYKGGIGEWIEKGGPVESSVARPVATRPAAALAAGPGRGFPLLTLPERSLGWLLCAWLGVVLGAGVLDWLLGLLCAPVVAEGGRPVASTFRGLFTAIYLSFVTATGIGYGDVVPVGPARAVAVIESVTALLLFGCVISKLVSQRQEELVEEIHRIAFEGRLGRVQMNLLKVLTEIQSIGAKCGTEGYASERCLARLESVVMIFTIELRAIHDILFRPQRVPESTLLESMLSQLAQALQEIGDLLERVPATIERSSRLRSGLGLAHRLAGEICGDCVPRDHAPELKVWMDRIHDLGQRLQAL